MAVLPCESKTVVGRMGATEMEFHRLTREHDHVSTMDGISKGFQRVKLPPAAAASMPGLLRKWQKDATLSTDASGPASIGAKTMELQAEARRAFEESTSGAVRTNTPSRVMASWDNEDTLRISVAMVGGGFFLIRQSDIFSEGQTAGAATADGVHTDMCPIGIEQKLAREAAERLGCSTDEGIVISVVGAIKHTMRSLGVHPEDCSDAVLTRLIEQGTLTYTRMWMSPNSAAKPLAFLDAATVDYDKYLDSDKFLHCFAPSGEHEWACDYTKPYRVADYPKDKKFGQIQLSYVPEAGHQWYYFDDLAEDEALLFDGAERTFHTAFVPMEQTATEERVSAETGFVGMVVRTKDPKSVQECACFLSAVRGDDGKFVFGTADGYRDIGAARAFIEAAGAMDFQSRL